MAEEIEVPMDAGRVCDAIARIGYLPAAALMDIVDNSVAANATKVQISLEQDPKKTYGENNNVTRYRVFDNGTGMENVEILNALKLGSPRDYPPGSLSKYGMGLKSAGLSLGSTIRVLSKKGGAISLIHFVDRQVIADRGSYIVSREEAPPEMTAALNEFLGDDLTGTLVEISNCDRRNHASAKKTIDTFQERMGVVYFTFLSREERPLNLTVRCTGKPLLRVAAKDMLFLACAELEFDKDTYECKKPIRVLKEKELAVGGTDVPKVVIDAVVFPKRKMSSCPDFSADERAAIKNYDVSRKNAGFFIYRNDRLIRWGDKIDIDGLSKDTYGFRARILLKTEHDDILHVDVSKQALSIPEDILKSIEVEVRLALRTSIEVFKLCDSKLNQNNREGDVFNENNQDFKEEDPLSVNGGGSGSREGESENRRAKLEIESEERLKAAGEKEVPPEEVETVPPFSRIRYSDQVRGGVLWEAGLKATEGTFVRINKNHSLYEAVFSKLSEGEPARQALEAVMLGLAIGENLTIQNEVEVSREIIEKVLRRFKQVMGFNLENWASENQNLFDND